MREIPLIKGQVALIDDEDYELVSQYKWYASWCSSTNSFYAISKVEDKSTYLHRLIMGLKHGNKNQVDHVNHNPLDNRKINLRVVSGSQNQRNRKGAQTNSKSGVLGVSWVKTRNKWFAQIQVHGKNINLGRYSKIDDAIQARNEGVIKYHGQIGTIS